MRSRLYHTRLHMFGLVLFVGTLIQSQPVSSAGPAIKISPGSGSFSFVDAKGDPSKQITVYTYLPARLEAEAARIVFVMHGHNKNASGYRDSWIEYAEKYGFMVVAPLFDALQWPRGAYSYASVMTEKGKPRNEALWSFSVVEHLFDAIKQATGNKSRTYFLYGHSEGGQFVHRLVLFLPNARYAKAVAANPGWYTMPTFDVKFPYGLRGSPVTKTSLQKSLGREFILMLGDRDTDPNHTQLRRTPKAMVQGAHRFQRGQNYMKEARSRSTELQCAFRWQLRVVPGAAHQNTKMSRFAAAALMGP